MLYFQQPEIKPMTKDSQSNPSTWNESILGQQTISSRFSKFKQRIKIKPAGKKLQEILSSFTYVSPTRNYSSQLSSGSNSSKSTYLTSSSVNPATQTNISLFNQSEPLLYQDQNDSMKTDSQRPLYIQYFSRLNSLIPNFGHPQTKIKQELKSLSTLLKAGLQAVEEVKVLATKLISKLRKSHEVKQLGLKFVCSSVCQTCSSDDGLQRLRPRQNFKLELIKAQDILDKILLMESKIERYMIVLSLTRAIDENLYMLIRKILMEIQEQLLSVSNSVYVESKKQKHYPSFCYAYVELIHEKI